MDSQKVRSFMKPDEFHPFDVRTSSGHSYHVRSPEMTSMSPEDDVMLVYEPDAGVVLIDVDEVTECVRPIKPRTPRAKGG